MFFVNLISGLWLCRQLRVLSRQIVLALARLVRHKNSGFIPLLVLLCLSWWLIFPTAGLAKDYRWPLDSPTRVTSTFGEIRNNHLHNGIDFSTLKQKGRKVKAVAPGRVKEVFFDPQKYGKTVVVEHENGRKSWYSHLAEIAPVLKQKLAIELEPKIHINPEEPFHLEQGEILGVAGATGEGPIHLHFALQAPNDEFINPLGEFSSPPPFEPRPEINHVKLYPVDGSGWINGSTSGAMFELPRSKPVNLWGRLGIAARVQNRFMGNQSLPYETALFRDDKLVTKRQFARLPKEQLNHGAPDIYHLLTSNIGPTQFVLNLSGQTKDKSWLNLNFFEAGNSGTLRIRTRTVTGNKTSQSLSYKTVLPPRARSWDRLTERSQNQSGDTSAGDERERFLAATSENRQRIQEQYSPPLVPFANPEPELELEAKSMHNRVKVKFEIDGGWKGWPEIKVSRKEFSKNIGPIQVAPAKFVGWWSPGIQRDGWHTIKVKARGKKQTKVDTAQIYLQSIRRTKSKAVTSLDGTFSLYTSGEGLNYSSFIHFRPVREYKNPKNGLKPISSPQEIHPSHVQSTEKMYLYATIPPTVERPEQIGLYRWNRVAEKWEVLSYRGHGKKLSNREREAVVHSLPRVALFRDTVRPEITKINRNKHRGRLIVQLNEAESGFNRKDLSVKLDSRELNFFYDQDEQRIVIPKDQFQEENKLQLKVVVSDRAGNTARRQFRVELEV